MSRRRDRHAMRYLMVGVCVLLAPAVAVAAPAARVEFSVGSVSATSPNGQTRLLAKGADVDSGDTVNTHDGRVQLRFSDGAYVSLQPQTLFRIDDYRYDGTSDGNERGFFSLLKGGLRTITGLVGRSNKRNYRISTTVATIGIRGTEYTLAYTNSVSGSVGEGEIEVCNGGGCQPVSSGQSFFIAGSNVKPEITSKKTDLPPSQPVGSTPSFVSGDQTSQNGDPNLFLLTGKQTVSTAVTGLFGVSDQVSAVFDSAGAATQLDLCAPSCGPQQRVVTSLIFPHGVDQFGNDGFIAWGRGVSQLTGSLAYTHYVSGLPTALADLNTLAINNVVATYSLLGGTSPTLESNGSIVATGTLTGASLTAQFNQGLINAVVNFTLQGNEFTLKSTMKLVQGTENFNIVQTGSPNIGIGASPTTAIDCSASAGGCAMSGFFAGSSASRAGVVYEVNTCPGCDVSGPPTIKGSVALVRKP